MKTLLLLLQLLAPIDSADLPTGRFIAMRVDTVCDTFVDGHFDHCQYDTMVWAQGQWRQLSPPDTVERAKRPGERATIRPATKPTPTTFNLGDSGCFPFGIYVYDSATRLPLQGEAVFCQPLDQPTAAPYFGFTSEYGWHYFTLPRSKKGYRLFTAFGQSVVMKIPGIDTLWISRPKAPAGSEVISPELFQRLYELWDTELLQSLIGKSLNDVVNRSDWQDAR